jgi:hypothetical protein
MGYLDGSAITVDAVLTKQGRRLLARGDRLNISSFCLSDTGVDYRLWNSDHPSGSANYGEAIENLPQVEALSQGEYFMRNRLLTLPRGTTALPIVDLDTPNAFDSEITSVKEKNTRLWSVATLNYSQPDSWIVICPNRQFLIPTQHSWSDIAGIPHQFIAAADLASAGMITIHEEQGGRANIEFRPAADDTARRTTLIFVSVNTGAWAADSDISIPITVTKYSVKD